MMRSRMAAAPHLGYGNPYRPHRIGFPPAVASPGAVMYNKRPEDQGLDGARHPLVLGPSSRTFGQPGMGSAMGQEPARGSTTTKMCLCKAKRMGGTCRCGNLGQGGCATASKGGGTGGVATGSGSGASPVAMALGGAGLLAVGLLVAGVI